MLLETKYRLNTTFAVGTFVYSVMHFGRGPTVYLTLLFSSTKNTDSKIAPNTAALPVSLHKRVKINFVLRLLSNRELQANTSIFTACRGLT